MNKSTLLLEDLYLSMDRGQLTPTIKVDTDSFVCITEQLGNGERAYYQLHFSNIPSNLQNQFLDQPKGAAFGPFKIVAIFDVWDINWLK